MKQFIENDITYYLGENGQDNHDMIDMTKKINDKYWWFHLADFPSGHCVVAQEELTKDIIYTACMLVKNNSKYYGLKNIRINYIVLKNIFKTNKPGEVKLKKTPNTIKF